VAVRFTVLPTANFGANLHSLREFLAEQGAGHVFDALSGQLFDEIISSLASFPRMGAIFSLSNRFPTKARRVFVH
jgi:hypothetical protein